MYLRYAYLEHLISAYEYIQWLGFVEILRALCERGV